MPNQPACSVLVIDDDPLCLGLLGGILRDLATVYMARTGIEGLALARLHRPTLILLDIEMQGMNGYQVCNQIRSDPALQQCAVIFVTGRSSMDAEVDALDAGAVDFINKPLSIPVVRARVRTHLKLQQSLFKLQILADRDGLTGLYNRRFFDAHFETEFARHRRHQLPLAVALIDVDLFKSFNDAYGHQAGDTCLMRIGSAIREGSKRAGEIVARYGGEEFVAILPYTSFQSTEMYGQNLLDMVRKLAIPHAASSVALHVTISVGVASVIPDRHGDACGLLGSADQALYQAKSLGRNQVVVSGIECGVDFAGLGRVPFGYQQPMHSA